MTGLLLNLWVSLGTFCIGIIARKMGYVRWSDLGLIPFGPFWFLTPFWWNEEGKRLWSRKP